MAELQVHESSLSHASNFRKRRAYHETEITSLLTECDKVLNEVLDESHAGSDPLLHHARELCTRAGLSMESDLTTFLYRNQQQQQSLHHQSSFTTTAGHSNTDHRIIWTGDYASDRIAELKRSLFTRNRYQCPEEMGDSRWDKPRAPGERRRRIQRGKDLPAAPPLPPPTGYVIYLGQMTTKWRHDRPDEPHDQSCVVREISKLWRIALSEEEQDFYNDFAAQIRAEYRRQHMEFRATGRYTPSEIFDRPTGAGLWIHKKESEKNALEREISQYETVQFPPRPPELDHDYVQRERQGRDKRKIKLKLERAERIRKAEEYARKHGLPPPRRRGNRFTKNKKETKDEITLPTGEVIV